MQILLAFDGSDESMESARFLTRLPTTDEMRVTVVSVMVEPQFDVITAESGIQLREVQREISHRRYDELRELLEPRQIKMEHVIAEGHPNRVLLQEAEKRNVDLLVLGARGHSAVARMLLGSTSDYVANHARCSVLVVRPLRSGHAPDASLRVVLAYDGSPGAEVAARQLFDMRWPAESYIQVTNLLERPSLIPDDVVYDPGAIADAQKQLDDLVAAHDCAAEVHCTVRESLHVGSAISALADREDADLIYVGDTGKSALARFFLGSATRHVLYHSHCSVWIAREKQWD